MNETTSVTAIAADDSIGNADTMPVNELLVIAARRSGKSPIALGREFSRLYNAGTMLSMKDFVRHSLWDTERHGEDGAARFVGSRSVWPISHTVNDKDWFRVPEDKYVMDLMCRAEGIPLPKTVGIVDRSARSFAGTPKIDTADKLRDLVLSHPQGSLFAKTLGGLIGRGVMVIEDADDTTIKRTGANPVTYEAFLEEVLSEEPYVLQERLDNHEALAPYCTGLTTIRFPNLVRGSEIWQPCVAMKLTTAGNIACAFWRPGNICCEIDHATGEIIRIGKSDGLATEYIDDHPEVPGLMGLKLPHWDKMKELNERTARVFGAIPYQSTDLAITPDGPVLVESNYAGSFDVLQNSTGRGLLTDEVKAFFRENGYDFDNPPKLERETKKKKFLGLF